MKGADKYQLQGDSNTVVVIDMNFVFAVEKIS